VSSSGSGGEVVQVESASSPGGASSLPLPLRAGSDTDVYAWGDRESGVAGHGEPLDGHQYVPRLLDALVGKSVCQVAACGFHTGAVTEFGEVFTWGEGKFGRLGHGKENNQAEPQLVEDDKIKNTRIVQIACGGFHTAAITDEGELFTWGGGEHGQLGHGNKENYSRPTLVRAIAGVKIKQVTCGWSHTVMLTEDGEVWSCGNGDHGKLGFGDTEKVTLPKKVEGLASKRICRVASYNEHTAALAMPADGLKAQPNSTLLADFGSLVGNSIFSDVAFLVEGQVIHAHRVVLASRCAHFRAMFLSGMKESRETEVKIMDTRALVFTALMQFLYTDVVDVSPDIAIELFVLADLYALDRLKAQCEAIVHRRLCHGNAPQLLSVADHHNCVQLKQLCLRYIIRHFDVISKSQEFAAVLNRELILEVLQVK
jgi:RCC1 and BTB domain-containing protein